MGRAAPSVALAGGRVSRWRNAGPRGRCRCLLPWCLEARCRRVGRRGPSEAADPAARGGRWGWQVACPRAPRRGGSRLSGRRSIGPPKAPARAAARPPPWRRSVDARIRGPRQLAVAREGAALPGSVRARPAPLRSAPCAAPTVAEEEAPCRPAPRRRRRVHVVPCSATPPQATPRCSATHRGRGTPPRRAAR